MDLACSVPSFKHIVSNVADSYRLEFSDPSGLWPDRSLYRRGVAADSFVLSDVLIVDGSLCVGLALFAMILASALFSAIGMSRDMEISLSLHLSPTQRLLLNMTGVWFGGAAVSLPIRISLAASYFSAAPRDDPECSILTTGNKGINCSRFSVLGNWKR
jgi:hypothetical protein